MAGASEHPASVPGAVAYVDGEIADSRVLPLCRLRYGGSASTWGFAIYRGSHDDYEDSVLPNGMRAGRPEGALDCACALYFGEPGAWMELRAQEGSRS